MGSSVVTALRDREELLAGRGLLFAGTGLYFQVTGLEVAQGPLLPVFSMCAPRSRGSKVL